MIPVPIITAVSLDDDGSAIVWFWHDEPRGARLPDFKLEFMEYRMIDNDPTRLEVVG